MTLKAFKAAVQPGVRMVVLAHWSPPAMNTVRTVDKVQGNGYWYYQTGSIRRMWGIFPKASQLDFDGSTARIDLKDGKRFWTLRFLPAVEQVSE